MDKSVMQSLNTQLIFVGEFNPAIVTPDWLAMKGLINADDLTVCRESIQAHGRSRLMAFQSNWFRAQIIANQLSISSLDGASPRVADLAQGLLMLLPETPVSAFGINFDAHFKVMSFDDYHKIGDFFAPKKPFLDVIPEIDGKKTSAGLLHLTIAIDSRPRDPAAESAGPSIQKRITIEPSNAVSPGIYFLYNHHVVVSNLPKNAPSDAVAVAEYMRMNWNSDMQEATSVFLGLLSRALT